MSVNHKFKGSLRVFPGNRTRRTAPSKWRCRTYNSLICAVIQSGWRSVGVSTPRLINELSRFFWRVGKALGSAFLYVHY